MLSTLLKQQHHGVPITIISLAPLTNIALLVRMHPEVPVDLVVSDQNMPGLSGVETAIELHRLRPGLKIAIISGHVNERLLIEASAAGVSEVMGKQDSMDALGEAIRGLLDSAA